MEKDCGSFIFGICSTTIVHLFNYTRLVYIINNLLHFRSNLNAHEYNMNKPKRTPTLDSFIIQKFKNIYPGAARRAESRRGYFPKSEKVVI